jgi:aryl-alcohol dehydrogenase-like predicted oxidoreductase
VREALDLGVDFFDTAAAYGTESVLGQALRGVPRDRVVIATKAPFSLSGPETAVAALDQSLRRLGTDYIDIYQLHGVSPAAYPDARDNIAPALLREKEKGKFRHLGITETAPGDPTHEMVRAAVADGIWDTVMVGFHMLHQNARQRVFPLTRAARVGTLLMFAVRNIFSQPGQLRATMRELAADGLVPGWLADREEPLDFLLHPGGAASLTDAAYRFVRHEPGVDVVLFGTGRSDHLRRNVASLTASPLPEADRRRLAELFGRLVGIGLDAPHLSPRRRSG